MMVCKKCNAEIVSSQRFCAGCGAKIEETLLLCKKCNAQMTPGQRFCHECGTTVKANEVTAFSVQSDTFYKKGYNGRVSEEAQKMFSEFFETGFDDEPRTQISELLDIQEQTRGFFPDCHALISCIYFEEFNDTQHSQKHVNLALQQEPNNALAIYQGIRLKYYSISQTASKAKKVMDNTSWIPYLGTFSVLTSAATFKAQESMILNNIINEVRMLSNTALPEYFNPQEGFPWLSFVAEMMLDCQNIIRGDNRLYNPLRNTLPVALMNLPWDRVRVKNDEETRNKCAKLLKKIKGETRV